MAISFIDEKDGVKFSGGGNGDAQTFTLLGGRYDFIVVATWGGGNVDLQALMPDGTTYQSVLTAAITANSSAVLDLAAGTYKVVITTASSVQGSLTRVPFRAA